jgi:hypothetical protein
MERSEVEYATAAPGERRKTVKAAKEAEVRRCIVTHFAALRSDPNFRCVAGEILRADHEAVRTNPHFFANLDATTQEMHDQLVKIGSAGTASRM